MDFILQYVLPSILGDFIQGIDRNHMKTNLLSGKVSLEGVSLNPAIIKSLNLPLNIVYSNIGCLKIKIPWLQRLKQPMEIYLEDLFVVLEQNNSSDYFDIVTDRVKFLDKLSQEIRNKLRKLNTSASKEEGSSLDYYKALILDNLQVTIKNIHVRFENSKKGYAYGLTLDEINMRTINEQGLPEFMDRTLEENKMKDLFKKLVVKDISLYWKANESSTSFISTSPCTKEEKKVFLKEMIFRKGDVQITQPILSLSLESQLVLKNLNKETNGEPRYKLDIDLKPIDVTLDNQQVNQMISTMNSIARAEREGKRQLKEFMLNASEDEEESLLFKKNLTEFLLSIEDSEFKWKDELANPKRREISDQIKGHLSKLTNQTLSAISREVIIKDEKRRLIQKMEKKVVSKGFFSFFKSAAKEKEENEELNKVAGYFDAFIQENEKISQNIMKGFVFEINLRFSEASIFLLDAKSLEFHGLLLTINDTRLKVQYHNHQEYDLARIEFLIKDIKLSIQKDALRQSAHKEITILAKYDSSNKQDFASLLFEMKNYSEGSKAIDIKGNIQGTELTFLPELVIGARKFLNFDKDKDDNVIDLAYEKMNNMSKNAQDQLKSVLDEFSSTITVSLTWDLFNVIVPLDPTTNRNSDSWILAINGFKVYTDPDASKGESQLYDNLKLELNSINIKYFEKVSTYLSQKSCFPNQPQDKAMFPLMDDTKIITELKVKRKMLKHNNEDNPPFILSFFIGNIAVNLNNLFYNKILELQKCFDFSQEKVLNEYLEIKKNAILQDSEGTFTVYFRENDKISNGWEKYTAISSGFNLLFYKNQNDLEAVKSFFTKNARVTIDKETYDSPHILKLNNQVEEIVISMETENDLNNLAQIIQNKNKEYKDENLSTTIAFEELQSIIEKDKEPISSNNITFKLNMVFEGLHLDLYEEFETKLNQISLYHLSIDSTFKDFDQTLKIQLASLSIVDYTLKLENNQPIQILSSNSEAINPLDNENGLIIIDARFLQDGHPDFRKLLNEKEVNVLFNSLSINYIPERVYFLMDFFLKPLSPKAAENNNSRRNSISSNNSNVDLEEEQIDTGKQYITKKADNKEEVRFIVGVVKVNELSLTLYTQISHIKLAKATLQNLATDIVVDKNALSCKGSLKNMQVFDLTNYQQGQMITEIVPYELIGIEKGSSVLEFEFTQRHEKYMKELKTDVENVINLNINSIRVNYINEPILRIANYFTNFILDFNFAEIKSFEQKMDQAIKQIRKPRFNNLNISINHPKVILKAKPHSQVYFELDIDTINVTNKVSKNTERILQKVPSLTYIFAETYKIILSDIVLTKKTIEGKSVWLSNSFKLDLDFERCLWENEYILANQINQDEQSSILDIGFYLKGGATPIFVKFNQEDYLDIMDTVNYNLAFEDMKDSQYHIEPEEILNSKYVTPIHMELKFEYIAAIAVDQIVRSPLTKAVALSTFIGFNRDKKNYQSVKIMIKKLIANYYEQNIESGYYIEKTLVGHSYIERETPMKDEESIIEIFKPEIIEQERKELENHKDTLIDIDYKKYVNQDKEMVLDIKHLACFLNLQVLLRLKDFFNLEDDDSNKKEGVQLGYNYNFKTHYRGMIEIAEINIPNTENTALILRSSIGFDWIKYDITDILKQKEDFLESSQLSISLTQNEIFVFNEKSLENGSSTSHKRSIVLPLSILYKTKESLSYESTNNKLLASLDNLCVIDKVVLKLSSTDSIVIAAILRKLDQEFNKYKNIPPFTWKSREALMDSSLPLDSTQMMILEEKNKIVHDGIQIRVTNDLSGVVVPLLEFSVHSHRDTPAVLFERHLNNNFLLSKNIFEISSSFYNSKVSKWEPIIEKWEFVLEMEAGEGHAEYKKKIDITNPNQDVLNINVSDEMLKVILLTWRDWNESYNQFNTSSSLSLSSFKPSESLNKMSDLISNQSEDNKVEHVSPFTIWNDTGYLLHVEPYLMGTNIKGISCTKKLDLQPGEQQDLIMDWTVERIFEASLKESLLERLQMSVWIEHPVYGAVQIPNIDIHNFGIKKRNVDVGEFKEFVPVICEVFSSKNKKFVRFGSSVVVQNSLPKPVYIQIYQENQNEAPFQSIIESNSSLSLPFDLTFNPISFHMDFIPENPKQIKIFKIDNLLNSPPLGLSLGSAYAAIRKEITPTYAKIHLEPLITLKNCLPFPLFMKIEGKRGENLKTIEQVLETQEEVSLLEFSHDFRIKMTCQAGDFSTNVYDLLPFDDKTSHNQTLFFTHSNGLAPLNVQILVSQNRSYKYFISAKTLVINETGKALNFMAVHDSSTFISPFKIPDQNGNELVLFTDIPALRILPKTEWSSQATPINLNQLGSFPVDILDSNNRVMNFGVHIRNIHCDKEQNIFTKVVSVLPRFIIMNKTQHIIQIYQPENLSQPLLLIPGERSGFNFSIRSIGRVIKIKIVSEKNQTEWKESGELDISSPGNIDFICYDSNNIQEKYFNLIISLKDASLFATLQEQDLSETSLKIKNNTSEYELVARQLGVPHSISIFPGATMPFAWVNPAANNVIMLRLVTNEVSSFEFEYTIAEFNKPTKYSIQMKSQTTKLTLCVVLIGRSRIIEISTEKDEVKENEQDKIDLLFRINLPALGISLISTAGQRKCELAYISLSPFLFALVDQNGATSLQLRIKSIMFDNNYHRETQFPVTFFAHNVKELQENNLPHLDFICKIKNKQKESDIIYIHDLGFYLARTCISLDGSTINAISDFMRDINDVLKKSVYSEAEYSEYIFLSAQAKKDLQKSYSNKKDVCISWRTLDPSTSVSDFIYIEKLLIQPIMLNLTFKNPQFDFSGAFVFAYIKNALGKALANLDNVPINLSGINVSTLYCTQDQAIEGLIGRYKELAKNSILKIVFSANIIGNPIKFFSKVSSGVNDLVDKPVKGFLEGPIQGGLGIIGGVGSLATKTIGATFNSLHGITDSLASGLTSLSGDKEFIKKREQRNSQKNSNVITGSVQAVSSVGKGFLSGITGVISKPIKGAAKGGIGGFMKGVYVGTKGLAIKPVAGILDGVSKLTEGVSNSLDKDTNMVTKKSRIPRIFYGKERIFKNYNFEQAKLINSFQNLKPEKYPNLTLLEIIFMDLFSNCLILTLEKVFLISLEKGIIVWKVKSSNLKEVFTSEDGVEVILKNPTKSIKHKLVLIPCKNKGKKAEISSLLSILKETVEDSL